MAASLTAVVVSQGLFFHSRRFLFHRVFAAVVLFTTTCGTQGLEKEAVDSAIHSRYRTTIWSMFCWTCNIFFCAEKEDGLGSPASSKDSDFERDKVPKDQRPPPPPSTSSSRLCDVPPAFENAGREGQSVQMN